MPPTKTPTSSLSGSYATCFSLLHLTVITTTATELPVKRILYRTPAEIRGMFSGSASPETPTIRRSHFSRFPVEILEMMIIHPIYTLRYAQPCVLPGLLLLVHRRRFSPPSHPYHPTHSSREADSKPEQWPKPLRNMHRPGLLPLTERVFYASCLQVKYYQSKRHGPIGNSKYSERCARSGTFD